MDLTDIEWAQHGGAHYTTQPWCWGGCVGGADPGKQSGGPGERETG